MHHCLLCFLVLLRLACICSWMAITRGRVAILLGHVGYVHDFLLAELGW